MAIQSSRYHDLYSGLIRLHVLHHAAREPIYGLWIIEELARHGYRLSPGTVYPLLHRLKAAGLLRSVDRRAAGRLRRMYEITLAGRRVLRQAKRRVFELFGELFEAELPEFAERRVARASRGPTRDRQGRGADQALNSGGRSASKA